MSTLLRPHVPLIVAIGFAGVIAFFAMNSQNNLLFWVVGMTGSAIIVSVLVSWISIRRLQVHRLDPKHGVVGEPLIITYALTNRSRFLPAFNVLVEESGRRGRSNWRRFFAQPQAWAMHVAPGETVHGEAVVWPVCRGEVRLDRLRYSTAFPFGMVRRNKSVAERTHTLVFPQLFQLRRRVLDAIIPAGPLGMKLSSRPGGGDDYFGLREYRPGDSRRQIAWKRSAGTDALVITERTMPSPPRLRVVLNLTVSTDSIVGAEAVSPRTLEERAISLAASIVEAAYHGGYEVGLSVLGANVPVTPLRCSFWHVEKIMAALASIDLDAARTPPDPFAVADAERAGIVLVHPGAINPSIIRSDAWHFSAAQLDKLVEPGARGRAPAPNGDDRRALRTTPDGQEAAA